MEKRFSKRNHWNQLLAKLSNFSLICIAHKIIKISLLILPTSTMVVVDYHHDHHRQSTLAKLSTTILDDNHLQRQPLRAHLLQPLLAINSGDHHWQPTPMTNSENCFRQPFLTTNSNSQLLWLIESIISNDYF